MNRAKLVDRFAQNIANVQQRMAAAAARSGRTLADVRLIAVTKYVDAETTAAMIEAGSQQIGENRPQVLDEKVSTLGRDAASWHMIGHLQRNKVKKVIQHADLIHSVDSLRLIDAIEKAAAGNKQAVNVLLEVNISGEGAKHGFATDQLQAALLHCRRCAHVSVRGLMCMAGLASNDDQVRAQFAAVRSLRDSLSESTGMDLPELSMGMSGDFEIAIEEGATLIRVGSVLYDGTDCL